MIYSLTPMARHLAPIGVQPATIVTVSTGVIRLIALPTLHFRRLTCSNRGSGEMMISASAVDLSSLWIGFLSEVTFSEVFRLPNCSNISGLQLEELAFTAKWLLF